MDVITYPCWDRHIVSCYHRFNQILLTRSSWVTWYKKQTRFPLDSCMFSYQMWHVTLVVIIRPTMRIPHPFTHYNDVIMSAMASQITGVSIAYSAVCSGADQRKHQSSTSLAFVRGIHRWPVNSPYKMPVTRKRFPFDDVIMFKWGPMCQEQHTSLVKSCGKIF